MLRELSIRNFAIIDDLQIQFDPGLTVLSGETGAGKSIILNAVNLLLGSRATAKLIRTGAKTAELEAAFEISPVSRVALALDENGYDPSEGLLVRRIISHGETNRIYINGRLATIQLLGDICGSLASISGQHAHQGLLKEDRHLPVIDQYGTLVDLQDTVRRQYRKLVPLLEALEQLKERKKRQSEQRELLRFQKSEISAAAIRPGEDRDLEQERTRLKNAAGIRQTVFESIDALYGCSGSISDRMAEIQKGIARAAGLDPLLSPSSEQISSLVFQLEDIVSELRTYSNRIESDDARLEAVEERLDILTRLKRKYGGTLENVLQKLADIEQELETVERLSDRIAETEAAIIDNHAELCRTARQLSQKRERTAAKLAGCVQEELSGLNMPATRFEVRLQRLAADSQTPPYLQDQGHRLSETGLDRAAFMISANVGETLRPLAAIASGGELSRVVLALKAILAKTDSVQTLIFDEVDAGIGGRVAESVGRKLEKLSRHHQVICITHLPQIARFAHQHYRISKHVSKGRTFTAIDRLQKDDRIREVARMLGGQTITETTLEHARELLSLKP